MSSEPNRRWIALPPMHDDKVYDEPSKVDAADGAVSVDGPDAVDVRLTPEAAEKTADDLTEQAVKARGQRRLKNIPGRLR